MSTRADTEILASQSRNSYELAYRKFLAADPKIFDTFRFYATQAMAKGRPFSAKLLAERVRWDAKVKWRRDRAGFKWNNNFTAYLARDLVSAIPALAPLLETRRTRDEYVRAA